MYDLEEVRAWLSDRQTRRSRMLNEMQEEESDAEEGKKKEEEGEAEEEPKGESQQSAIV